MCSPCLRLGRANCDYPVQTVPRVTLSASSPQSRAAPPQNQITYAPDDESEAALIARLQALLAQRDRVQLRENRERRRNAHRARRRGAGGDKGKGSPSHSGSPMTSDEEGTSSSNAGGDNIGFRRSTSDSGSHGDGPSSIREHQPAALYTKDYDELPGLATWNPNEELPVSLREQMYVLFCGSAIWASSSK